MTRRRSSDSGGAAAIFLVLLVIAFVIKFWPWILGAVLLWLLIKFGLPAGQRAIRDRPPQRRTGGPLRPAARGPDERRHHTRHVRRVPATGGSEVKRNEYAEPTEMAGIAEADTEMAYAWALDYDDPDEFPTQRLTPRRITSLAIAASLVTIAVAGAVALTVTHDVNQPVAQAPSSSVVETVPPQHITVTAPPPVTVTVPAKFLA